MTKEKNPMEEFGDIIKVKPSGTKTHLMKLDNDTSIMQVMYADGVRPEIVAEWARDVRSKLPSNVMLLVTSDEIKIDVKRPLSVEINFVDSVFDSKDLVAAITKALKTNANNKVTVNFKNSTFTKKLKEKVNKAPEKSSLILPPSVSTKI